MEKIKFRQWLGNGWHYWGFVNGSFVSPAKTDAFFIDQNIHQQFTGLLDKKGNEIWEGDIVDYGVPTKMFIKYGDGMFEFWHTEKEKAYHWGIWNIHKDLEVIGNIFENPDLLKGGSNDENGD